MCYPIPSVLVGSAIEHVLLTVAVSYQQNRVTDNTGKILRIRDKTKLGYGKETHPLSWVAEPKKLCT